MQRDNYTTSKSKQDLHADDKIEMCMDLCNHNHESGTMFHRLKRQQCSLMLLESYQRIKARISEKCVNDRTIKGHKRVHPYRGVKAYTFQDYRYTQNLESQKAIKSLRSMYKPESQNHAEARITEGYKRLHSNKDVKYQKS